MTFFKNYCSVTFNKSQMIAAILCFLATSLLANFSCLAASPFDVIDQKTKTSKQKKTSVKKKRQKKILKPSQKIVLQKNQFKKNLLQKTSQKKETKQPIIVGKKTIVIDAGHGGNDPGAVSSNGVFEKTITLLMANALQKELATRSNYHIVLTRSDDRFIRLRERLKIARQNNADLFLSLHADSHKNKKYKGFSVYVLSEKASDHEAMRLAKNENTADLINGVDIDESKQDAVPILLDLAQHETMTKSEKLAKKILRSTKKSNTIHLAHQHFRGAGFAVLKAPDVPSVLIELAYLSNADDAKKLKTPAYIALLAKRIAIAVDEYFLSSQQ